jgi:pimeloyl-ACP methyl ester carboxylesterase
VGLPQPRDSALSSVALVLLHRMNLRLLFSIFVLMPAICFAQDNREHGAPRSAFAEVNGIRLHYLDWGGNGEPLLLLPGLGNDAHVFDNFAEKFTDRFRVLALTRRGFGESDAPAAGYDTASRTEDIREFLDAMDIRRINIAGHSMAGSEITAFASLYPERIQRLVYLDAAYDHTCSAGRDLEPWASSFSKRLYAELEDPAATSSNPLDDLPPSDRWEAIKATVQAVDSYHPNYSMITAPALALYAPPERYPDAPRGTSIEARKSMDEWWRNNRQDCALSSIEQFRTEMERGEVMVIRDGYHYLFLGVAQGEVVKRMRAFLLEPAE